MANASINSVNTPTNIQTGYLYDENGKKFDVTVILNFPTNEALDNPDSSDDDIAVNLVDFYFGTPNDHDTDWYTKQFVEKQFKLRLLLDKLENLKIVLPDLEIDEQIEFVKSLLVNIH